MNHDLRYLTSYFRQNFLALNETKTKHSLPPNFHQYFIQPTNRNPVIASDNTIEQVDSHMNFGNHKSKICGSVSPALAALYKIRSILPLEFLKFICYSLFNRQIDKKGTTAVPMVLLCSIATWSIYDLSEDKTFLCIVYGSPSLYPTINLYIHCVKNVLPISGIYVLQIVRLVRQVMNEEIFHQTIFAFREGVQSLRGILRIGAPNVHTDLVFLSNVF